MANKTIAELTAATAPLSGDELLHGVQGGNSRRMTVDEVRGPILASLADLTLAQGDLLYVNGDGEIERLAKGAAGQFLTQNSGLTAPEWRSLWTELAPVATTSGTEKDWIGIPAGVTDIELWFDGVSGNSSDDFLVQIGTGGVPTTTGYSSGAGVAGTTTRETATIGMVVFANIAANVLQGCMRFHRTTGDTWISEHTIFNDPASGVTSAGGGRVSLAGALDNIRVRSLAGTQAFDAGSIQVRYR